MPFWKRKGNRIPFHVTDVENFYAAVRDGNNVSALRFGVRVLDRGLNGPTLRAGDRNTFEEYEFSDKDAEKLKKISADLQQLIDENELRVGREQLKTHAENTSTDEGKEAEKGKGKTAVTTRKDAKRNEVAADQKKPDGTPAKEPVEAEDKGEPGVDPQAPLATTGNVAEANDKLVGAVPWALIAQIAMAIMQLIQQWKQQNP